MAPSSSGDAARQKNGRIGIVNAPARDPGCGDASACLKLRPPVIRRDRET